MTRLFFAAWSAATLGWVAMAAPALEAQQRAPSRPPSSASAMGTSERMVEDRIYLQLAERAWVGADFKARVQDGAVTLSGTVPSEQSKQRILRIARGTPGVFELRDQLQVNPAVGAGRGGSTVSDADLAKRVAEEIAAALPGAKAGEDWWFTGWRVEGQDRRWNLVVEADAGQVTLEGEVPLASIMRTAVEAAMGVPGVRSVRSDLEREPAYGPYADPAGYPRHSWWGYPYYGASPFYGYGGPHGFQGTHTVRGEVLSVDRQKGTISLKNPEGTVELNFPPSALKDVQKGDEVVVQMGLREVEPR